MEWYSSDTKVAEVSATGLVSVKGSGSATVGVRSVSDPSVKAEIPLRAYCKPDQISIGSVLDVRLANPGGIISRKSEYIGVGATQRFKVSYASSKGTDLLPGSVGVRSVTGAATASVADGVLTVTVPASQTPSTSTTTRKSVVKLACPGGYVQDFDFLFSRYDPYQPKPGDGIWSTSAHIAFDYSVVDSGYRGEGIYEEPLFTAYKYGETSLLSKVYAVIAWIGDDHLTEDPKYKDYRGTGLAGTTMASPSRSTPASCTGRPRRAANPSPGKTMTLRVRVIFRRSGSPTRAS